MKKLVIAVLLLCAACGVGSDPAPTPRSTPAATSIAPPAAQRVLVEEADYRVRSALSELERTCPIGSTPDPVNQLACSAESNPGSLASQVTDAMDRCEALKNKYNAMVEEGALGYETIVPKVTDNRRYGGKITCNGTK